MVGYVAGRMTETGKVGFVGGISSGLIDQFQYGYEAGVKYAAKELGRDIDISVQYAESFSDAAKGKAIATKMYSDGCDVIYHAAGGSGTGVIEAAKEADKWVIGVDRDQAYLAPENVLTSALKLVGKAVKEVSIEAMEGKTIGGQTLTFGLKEDCVGIPEEHGNMADGVYEDTLKVAESIKNGELVPPTKMCIRDSLCRDFVYMTQKIDQLVQENYVKQLVIKETELRALQAQINPHFLYNVLESVNCMAVIAHQPDISVMVKSLGSLLREAMSNQEIFHTIKQELGLIEAYLAIQSIRFENKLSYELMVEESVMNWEVPKFFLQPIVENAVVYGIEATGKGCHIRIQIKSENSRLYAEISDSGPGMDENVIQAIYNGTIKGRGNGIGLHNIIKRLDIM